MVIPEGRTPGVVPAETSTSGGRGERNKNLAKVQVSLFKGHPVNADEAKRWWLNAMTLMKTREADEEYKLAEVVLRFKEDTEAAGWWQSLQETVANKALPPINTLADLEPHFLAHYCPAYDAEHAMTAASVCKQGNRTFDEYVQELRGYFARAPSLPLEFKRARFRKGLQSEWLKDFLLNQQGHVTGR